MTNPLLVFGKAKDKKENKNITIIIAAKAILY